MTVSELVAELQKYPPDAPVMIELTDYADTEYAHVRVVGQNDRIAYGRGAAFAAVVLQPR